MRDCYYSICKDYEFVFYEAARRVLSLHILVMSYSYSRHIMQLYSYFCSFRGDVSIMIFIYRYISFVVIGDEYKTFQELHVMYRIYHPILKFYQMLRVVPRHNPIREMYHNPIRNSYRMIIRI